MRKSLFLFLLLPFFALSLSSCERFGHHKGHGYWIDKKINRLASKLDLTDAQEKHLNEIKDEIKAEHKKRHASQNWHESLIAEIKKEKIEPKTLEALADKHHAHRKAMMSLVAKRLSEFHATLTSEQKDKLVELIEKFKEKHGRWHK